jgi:DNA-binding transcriptional LysR family regulator
MLDLNDFRYFVEVVDQGGFSSAGRSLRRPTSTISYRIKNLERELRLTLLSRTSRNVSLTESGSRFYRHAVEMLERALDAELAMRDIAGTPVGKVRYTVGIAPAQFAMQNMVQAFLETYPDVRLEQNACDSMMDLVVDRLDLAIRSHFGPLPDSGFTQRPLANVPWHLFAAPALFGEKSIPRTPEELAGHETLFLRRDTAEPVWHLRLEKDRAVAADISVTPRMTDTCMVTLKAAAAAGMGMVALPAYTCREEISAARLVRVLPDWIAGQSAITALMPSRRGMTAAARAFLDHLAAEFPKAVQIS